MMAKRKASPPPSDPIIGPTDQARQHADYERREVNMGERRPYVRVASCLIDVLLRQRALTRQQAEACHAFARDHRLIFGSPSTRDSCVQRVGGEPSPEAPDQIKAIGRAKERTASVLSRAGPMPTRLLICVAVYEQPLGRNRGKAARLYDGLFTAATVAADVYGIPTYSDA